MIGFFKRVEVTPTVEAPPAPAPVALWGPWANDCSAGCRNACCR